MMTKDQFESEVGYLVSCNIASRLKSQQLINKEEFAMFDNLLQKKYSPILCLFLKDN